MLVQAPAIFSSRVLKMNRQLLVKIQVKATARWAHLALKLSSDHQHRRMVPTEIVGINGYKNELENEIPARRFAEMAFAVPYECSSIKQAHPQRRGMHVSTVYHSKYRANDLTGLTYSTFSPQLYIITVSPEKVSHDEKRHF